MKKTNKTSSSKKATASKTRSLKGIWGKVGAPPKKTTWPGRPFTMEVLFLRNPAQCELSLRKKVEKAVIAGTITELTPLRRPGAGAGRPKNRFVMTEFYDPTRMVKADKTPKFHTVNTVQPVMAPTPVPVTQELVTA